jgi:anaerobic ribonucleoside-triphosphate reductase
MEKNKDLVLEDGKVVPEKQRTRCEIYSRCVGYLRPVQHWNAGKKQEFIERKTFKVENGEEIQTSDR